MALAVKASERRMRKGTGLQIFTEHAAPGVREKGRTGLRFACCLTPHLHLNIPSNEGAGSWQSAPPFARHESSAPGDGRCRDGGACREGRGGWIYEDLFKPSYVQISK